MAGQQDGPSQAAEPSREQTFRETVELTADLVEALVTQARRAQRQCFELDGSPAVDSTRISPLLERLGRRAASLDEDITLIRDSLSHTIGDGDGEPGAPGGEDGPGEDAEADSGHFSDPARMLATEMVTQGRTREEVEAYLVETYGLDNATEIVDDVWTRTGRA